MPNFLKIGNSIGGKEERIDVFQDFFRVFTYIYVVKKLIKYQNVVNNREKHETVGILTSTVNIKSAMPYTPGDQLGVSLFEDP